MMYMPTSFRGTEHAELGEKGCALGHICKYWLEQGHKLFFYLQKVEAPKLL